jgi:predicted membrane protein
VSSLALRCLAHPERPGIGVCTRCRATLCEECATRVEGILHCRDCLALQASVPTTAPWRSLPALLPALLLGPLTAAAVATLVWLVAVAWAALYAFVTRGSS